MENSSCTSNTVNLSSNTYFPINSATRKLYKTYINAKQYAITCFLLNIHTLLQQKCSITLSNFVHI